MSAMRAPLCTLTTGLNDTVLTTWFERDRAHVCLSRKDRDGEAGETIHEWWDEAVAQAVADGFLDPRNWHGAAFAYASHLGMIKPLQIDLTEGWPFVLKTFLEKTPSKERPRQQPDRLEWYADMARETDELYEMALVAEERQPTLCWAIEGGTVEIETDGENMILRSGDAATQRRFNFGAGRATFSLTWLHSEGPQSGDLSALFEFSDKPGAKQDKQLAEDLRSRLVGFIEKKAEEFDRFVLQTREWKAFIELEQALGRADRTGTSAEAQELAYDESRAATLLGKEVHAAPAPVI
jgi:hypothetical protein